MLKKAGAVALSASMLFASNCAISTKAAEEKAAVATSTQTKEQNKVMEFLKKYGLALGVGTGTVFGAVVLSVAAWYRLLRNHLQASIDDLVKFAKKDKLSESDLKAKAEEVLKCAKWVIIASDDNKKTKEEVEAAIEDLFKNISIKPDGVKTKENAKDFLNAIGTVFNGLKDQKSDGKEDYSVRKNRGIFKKKALFMQYKDAAEVAKMFEEAAEKLGSK